MKLRWLAAAGLPIMAAALAGCRGTAMPNFAHPGGAEKQRMAATRYDPYPETNIGPNVDGARPREYQTPVAEPVRSRWYLDPKGNNERWSCTGGTASK